MSYDYDLEQPADVHWIPVDLMPPQEIGGGKETRFATLREAGLPASKEIGGVIVPAPSTS